MFPDLFQLREALWPLPPSSKPASSFENFLKCVHFYLFILAAEVFTAVRRLSPLAVSWSYSLVAVCGLLTVVVRFVAEHSLWGTEA